MYNVWLHFLFIEVMGEERTAEKLLVVNESLRMKKIEK